MSRRTARVALVVSAVLLVVHPLLVRAMAHGHVAHALLGAGHRMPPASSVLLVVALLVARLLAIVVVPGLVLAAVTSLVADSMRKRSAILPDR